MLAEAKKGPTLFPPAPDRCQQCAVAHGDGEPHDQDSLYWQTWFFKHYGRWPTWADAMAHCDSETRQSWCEGLVEKLREDRKTVPRELLEGAGG